MTNATKIIAVALATHSLAACGEPETQVVGGVEPDAVAKAAAAKAPVALPPAIASSKTYRCKDKSGVYANFLTDGLTVNVRDKEEEPPAVNLKAATAGEPFEGVEPLGKGFRMVGSGDEVTYTSPDSGTQICKA